MADFQCPKCGALNDKYAVECTNCGIRFALIDTELCEDRNFYFYGEYDDYLEDLEKKGYDDSSRKMENLENKVAFLIIIIPVVAGLLISHKVFVFSWTYAVIVGLLMVGIFILLEVLDRRVVKPPEKIFEASALNFCFNCRYRSIGGQEFCPLCLENFKGVNKLIMLPHVDLVFKDETLRVYSKKSGGSMHSHDVWGTAQTGFFTEYDRDKIYDHSFYTKKSLFSKKETFHFSFRYDYPVLEYYWDYLTLNRRTIPKGLWDPTKNHEVQREIWDFQISEKAMYEIQDYLVSL
ncbi:MAG: hypothetical protein HVN35_01400 [Methanobacteriaceae archaeon]|nr:hypothetical protein [Methanobacteriaceae archaeon]